MLLDVTLSGGWAFALFCPLMMVLMMVGMAFMGGGNGHGMCGFWSHGSHHEGHHREEDEVSK